MKNNLRKIVEKILKFFAQKLLDNLKPDIIAITGSVGKSSTKEAIYAILSKRLKGKVWKNEGNLNEEIGVPLSILGFKHAIRWFEWPVVLIACAIKVISYKLKVISYPQILILEFAANKPGDIQYLTSFVKPKISVITAIGLAHTKTFGSLENIIKEKGYLIEVLPKDGWAVLNHDDSNVKKMALRTKARVIYYHGSGFDSDQKAAHAVGKIYGLSEKEINAALKDYQPLDHRMNIVEGIKDTIIIDDSYNANPLSMERALKKLQVISPDKVEDPRQSRDYKPASPARFDARRAGRLQVEDPRKIAVLGDMLELGDFAKKAHLDVAKHARAVADLLITVGTNFAKTKSDNHFNNSEETAEFLLKEVRKGDIILVKGSRGMRMEHVVDTLRTANTGTKHHEILV